MLKRGKEKEMVRTGFVKQKKGELLSVCFERPEACAGCKGCAKGLMPKKELLTVFGQAEVGDRVDVQMPEAQMLKATLIAYVLPLCVFLLGLGAGYALRLSEGITLLLAVAGLALGYLAARGIDMKLRSRPRWRPVVLKVYSMDKRTEKEELS